MDRRTLLKYMALNSLLLPFSLQANNPKQLNNRRLILIELKGGNDGLNTVIPYQDPLYYKLRPNIAIDKNSVLPLNRQLALHPSLQGLKEIYDNREVAIIQGVGYPKPNRSHFRSIEIWDSASNSHEYLDQGWLAALSKEQTNPLKGIILGGEYGPLSGMSNGVIKINNLKRFLNQSKQIKSQIYMTGNNDALTHLLKTEAEIQTSASLLKRYLKNSKPLPFSFSKSNFGNQMRIATQLINSGAGTSFYKVSLGSFDTHVNQANKHAKLLKELSEGIATMRKNLMQSGEWENTLIMTYSEFGRRAAENGSRGTDHGTAAPHFVIGGMVRGGIYGKHPSLSALDKNGDLIHTTDFRSVYKSVANEWLQTSSPLLGSFSSLNIL